MLSRRRRLYLYWLRKAHQMDPVDIGLPPKFARFYPEQLDTAIHIGASPKRFFIDAAPTGFGKSLMYMAVAQLLEARAVVLTANKGLQEQLMRDFGAIGLVDIRGQSNYPCKALADKKGFQGCDKGPCHHGVQCELHPRFGGKPGCDWFDALKAANKARLLVTNYDMWMAANRYMEPGLLGERDLLILDEAHDAPDKLAEFCEVELDEEECGDWLGDGLPPVEDGADAWADWAAYHMPTLDRELKAAADWAGSDPDRARRLRQLAGKVEFLSTARVWQRGEPSEPTVGMPGIANDWVGERTGGAGSGNGKGRQPAGARFSPVWAHRYAERFLFRGIGKVVLVSATIMPVTATYLGIPEKDSEFREHQSGFHPDRRPVYIMPAAKMGMNATDTDYRAWMVKMDQIMAARPDRRGLILTVSYKLADHIIANSAQRGRMDWCKKKAGGWSREAARDVVDRFKKSPPGTVLVGPAFDTGFDFPYDECEFIIIAKVPFIDNRAAVIKARAKSDKRYLNYVAALKLIQGSGRGMRAADDRCETFIVDSNIGWFMQAAKGLMPMWFKKAVKWADRIPAAPPTVRRVG